MDGPDSFIQSSNVGWVNEINNSFGKKIQKLPFSHQKVAVEKEKILGKLDKEQKQFWKNLVRTDEVVGQED